MVSEKSVISGLVDFYFSTRTILIVLGSKISAPNVTVKYFLYVYFSGRIVELTFNYHTFGLRRVFGDFCAKMIMRTAPYLAIA